MDTYGNKLLLCTELAHKLINLDTVWDVMEKFYRDRGPNDYKANCLNYLVGQTVMTSYNKKTYRIDDIAWEQSPMDTFEKKGTQVSFIDYYYESYKIRIEQQKQPLLVTSQKLRDNTKRTILLIPELCVLTGNQFFFTTTTFSVYSIYNLI